MTPPGALRRAGILLRLRLRLMFRAKSAKRASFIFMGMVNVAVLVMAALLAAGMAFFTFKEPAAAANLVPNSFGSIFLAQVLMSLVGLSSSEFFDVSRIMHLPVAAPEVFGGMVLSGFFSVVMSLYVATPLGIAIGCGGGALLILARVLLILALVSIGHMTALAIHFLLATAMTRRRMRDLAMVLGSLLGVALYVGFRVVDARYLDKGNSHELALLPPPAFYRWLPTQGLVDLWQADFSALALLRIAFSGSFAAAMGFIGASRLQRLLSGEVQPGAVAALETRAARDIPFLAGETAASFRLHLALMWRDPQLRMQWFQGIVFVCLPWVFLSIKDDGDEPGLWAAAMLPALLVLAHAGFHHSFFGADSRGLTQLVLTPARRTRLILGRLLAVVAVCVVVDLLASILLLLGMGVLADDTFRWVPHWPLVAAAVLIFHLVAGGVGAIYSTRWPAPLTAGDRRAAMRSGQGQGCATQVLKLLLFLPEFALSAFIAGFGLLPILEVPYVKDVLPPAAVAITYPIALALACVVAFVGCQVAARTLETREEEFLQALRPASE